MAPIGGWQNVVHDLRTNLQESLSGAVTHPVQCSASLSAEVNLDQATMAEE